MKIINSEWFIDVFESKFRKLFIDLNERINGLTAGEILEQFKSISDPTLADLERLTGSNSWTTIFCRECFGFQSEGMYFNNNWDADNLLFVCSDCLELSLSVLRK